MKEKRDSEEMSQTSSSFAPTVTPNESFDAVDLARFETNGNCSNQCVKAKTATTSISNAVTTAKNNANTTTDPNNIVQTTLVSSCSKTLKLMNL